MSPQNVSNFVADLVEMAEATRKLPEIQAALEEAQRKSVEDGERIARLEMKLIDAHNEADALRTKLRSVEAERDDAGFRLLEAEDKIDAVFRAIGANKAPVEVVNPVPLAENHAELSLQSQDDPFEGQGGGLSQPITTAAPSSAIAPDGTVSPGEQHPDVAADAGQSVSPPTPASAIPESVKSTSVTSQDGVSESVEPQPSKGPYHGKHYVDHPFYVSLNHWLEGGGTEEDYYWRSNALGASGR